MPRQKTANRNQNKFSEITHKLSNVEASIKSAFEKALADPCESKRLKLSRLLEEKQNILWQQQSEFDWKIIIIDGTYTKEITIKAPDISRANETAIKYCEKRYGTSNWRVIKAKRLN